MKRLFVAAAAALTLFAAPAAMAREAGWGGGHGNRGYNGGWAQTNHGGYNRYQQGHGQQRYFDRGMRGYGYSYGPMRRGHDVPRGHERRNRGHGW